MSDGMTSEIKREIEASMSVKGAVLNDSLMIEQVRSLVNVCLQSLKAGGKIIFAGNGGSFADAQHLSAEFTSRFQFDRAPLASLALGTNNSTNSAIGNDYGYQQVFSRELAAIAKPGDVFIPITTSGNSGNIVAAIETAKAQGIATVCLTGQTGGKVRALCNCICVPSTDTARIQECHIMLGHIICGLIERIYFQRGEAI